MLKKVDQIGVTVTLAVGSGQAEVGGKIGISDGSYLSAAAAEDIAAAMAAFLVRVADKTAVDTDS